MAEIGIIYGSSTGNTRDVCQKLQQEFTTEHVDVLDVREIELEALNRYPNLILAVSTWGVGDLQDDWEEFYPAMDDVDLSGQRVAIMGLGDQKNYPDAFGDAVAILANKVRERGGELVGQVEKDEDYTYTVSRAESNGRLLGLLIDEDSQRDKTDMRVRAWVAQLRKEFSLNRGT
jgi:flavodoxin I